MKVRAAVCHGPNRPLVIEEVDFMTPSETDVVVRLKATGLCHSDLNVIEGHRHRTYPIILGHEGAGVVVECGKAVRSLKPGDHVIPSAMPHCADCDYCRSRRTHMCRRFNLVSSRAQARFSLNGEPVVAMAGLGAFAEYIVVPEISLARIRADAPLDVVCYVACGVMTGVGAVLNGAKVEPGSSVVVFGAGGVGLNVVQAARLAGARTIIAIDANPAKEAPARRFGATHVIVAKTAGDLVAEIRDMTGGGADYSFECVGHPDLIRQAYECVEPAWGLCTLLGVPPDGARLAIEPSMVVTSGRRLQGSLMGSMRGPLDLPQLVDWYMDGAILIDELITHRLALDDINVGFDLMRNGQSIRTVVSY